MRYKNDKQHKVCFVIYCMMKEGLIMIEMEHIFENLKRLWKDYCQAKESMTSYQFSEYPNNFKEKNDVRIGYSSDDGTEIRNNHPIKSHIVAEVADVDYRHKAVEVTIKRWFSHTIEKKSVPYFRVFLHYPYNNGCSEYIYLYFDTEDSEAGKLNKGDKIEVCGYFEACYYPDRSTDVYRIYCATYYHPVEWKKI